MSAVELLMIRRDLGEDRQIATALVVVAEVLVEMGSLDPAARLWAVAERVLIETALDVLPIDRLRLQDLRARLEAIAPLLERVQEETKSTSLVAAIDLAQSRLTDSTAGEHDSDR
jgi:hypothetical protein